MIVDCVLHFGVVGEVAARLGLMKATPERETDA